MIGFSFPKCEVGSPEWIELRRRLIAMAKRYDQYVDHLAKERRRKKKLERRQRRNAQRKRHKLRKR